MTTALAKREPKTDLAVYLESNVGELAKACAASISAATMLTVFNVVLRKTPDLQKCSQQTVLSSIVEAASLGLSLNPSQGEAYLIPRRNKNVEGRPLECNFQPGYRGLAKLVRGKGDVEYIRAMLVYAKDEFRVVHEPDSALYHTSYTGPGRGPVVNVYSVVCFKSGRKIYEVMTFQEIEEIRKRSDGADGPFWKFNWGEMARKTVIKRHCKQLDQTPELARAIEADNREYEESLEAPVVPQNNSGHGRGQYANNEQIAEMHSILKGYCETVNQRWLDSWTQADGSINPHVKEELLSIWQLDGHMKKWACETERLDPASLDTRVKNIGAYTAIVWFRVNEAGQLIDRDAMKIEMNDYQRRCWKNASEAIRAKEAKAAVDTRAPYVEPAREPGDDDDDALDGLDDGFPTKAGEQ